MKLNLDNMQIPCMQCYIHGGGYWDCKITDNDDRICEVEKDFAIDWKAVCRDYGIEVNI